MIIKIIQLLFEITTTCLGVYLVFFKSYFEERGKIVATKKDIEEITEKIERVKSSVEILTHRKISLSTEKQNCLLDFNDKFSKWLNYIVTVDISGEVSSAALHALKVEEKYDQLYYDFLTAESKVDIFFIKDRELIESIRTIKSKTIDLSSHFRIFLVKAKNEAFSIQLALQLPDILPENLYKKQELSKYYGQRNSIAQEYYSKRLELYKPIVELNYELLKIIHNRIHDFAT